MDAKLDSLDAETGEGAAGDERTAALEQEVARLRRYERLVALALDLACIMDFEGRLLFVNQAWEEILGYPVAELHGRLVKELIHPDDLPRVEEAAYQLVASGGRAVRYESRWRCRDGAYRHLEWSVVAVLEEQRTYGFARDVTPRREAEALIKQHEEALRALSTPLIPINDRVLVMPLVGSLDARRAEQVIQTLLEGVAQRGASAVILDVTGVAVVDTHVADALVRAARAVGLVGARVILTGIRPEVAQTLVALGADLSGITTCGTLQAGIARATG